MNSNDEVKPLVEEAFEGGGLSVADFCRDEHAVLEWRQFLQSATGKKLRRVLEQLDPVTALATEDATAPSLIRAAARLETESAEMLLGKATGYRLALHALFRRLPVMLKAAPPASRRSGRRDIPGHPAAMP